MSEIDSVILDKIIELSNNAVVGIENITIRMNILEKNIDHMYDSIHGNENPGLNEKIRNFHKSVKDIKSDIDDIHSTLEDIGSMEDKAKDKEMDFTTRLSLVESKMKVITAISITAVITLITLIIKSVWNIISMN